MDRKYLKIIGGVLATILIAILAVSLGFLIYGRIYSARVNIMVAPSIAKVKIGEQEFPASGEFNLKPGEYAVEVSAEGFATRTGTLTAKADETVNLQLYLISSSDATKNWYNENAGDALIMGEIINSETIAAVDKLLEREPVLQKLPLTIEFYENNYSKYVKYVISYARDNSEKGFYLIYKDCTGEGQEKISAKLAEMGMNLNDVRIEYENLEGETMNGKAF